MARRRVAVTGLGLVDPFGGDARHFFARLTRGESAISWYRTEGVHCDVAMPALQCSHFHGEEALGRALAHTMDRFAQLGMGAALAAWHDAGLPLTAQPEAHDDFGVAWGTAVGGTVTFERGYRNLYLDNHKKVSPLSVVLGMNNAAASHIAIRLGLGAACQTYSVACASSAVAIGEGLRNIREGRASLMIVGGSECPFGYGVVRAWEALRVLAPGDAMTASRACRPFSADRAGLVLGEGAGALVIEEWDHALARGAHIYAELAGYGSTCDHSHLVRPDSAGQIRAIEEALDDAALRRDEIDYVNAHGTATREGDPTEVAALKAVFGTAAQALPVSATKSMHGHMLGASSAIEAIITVLALEQATIPPTAHLAELDPACAGVRHVCGEALRGTPLRAALSNTFAFGGSNAVLAFRAAGL